LQCPYYSKAKFLKRLGGTMGYCELQDCLILRDEKVGRIPHIYCEGLKGKSNSQCGVFVYSIESSKASSKKA